MQRGPATIPSRLRGMQDVSHQGQRIKRSLQDGLSDLMAGFGYLPLEPPILEPTELFLRKSGGELASRLYSFTDPGGVSVSLRPEFTSSIMRHYLENASNLDLPARWQYSGPVFRHDPADPQTGGQFTQIGAELVGASGVLADVEVLGLACLAISNLGVDGWQLELSDLDVMDGILDAVGVSQRARSFIISNAHHLSAGRSAVPDVLSEASRWRLTGSNGDDQHLSQAIAGLDEAEARVVLNGLLQWGGAPQMGQRQPDEVVDRLLRKLRGLDTEANLRRGLELASDLASVRGTPDAALEAAAAVVKAAGADGAALDRLSQLLELLSARSEIANACVLDFGLVRGLGYYNGIVFELNHPASGASLGGGGRYDALAQSLGNPGPVPALGFAYHLESLIALSGEAPNHASPSLPQPQALVIADGPESYADALAASQDLRSQGVLNQLDVDGLGLQQALDYAQKQEISQVIVIRPGGHRETHAVD